MATERIASIWLAAPARTEVLHRRRRWQGDQWPRWPFGDTRHEKSIRTRRSNY